VEARSRRAAFIKFERQISPSQLQQYPRRRQEAPPRRSGAAAEALPQRCGNHSPPCHAVPRRFTNEMCIIVSAQSDTPKQ